MVQVGADLDYEYELLLMYLGRYPPPENWGMATNPPYSYYVYYLFVNLSTLNRFRRDRGLSVFLRYFLKDGSNTTPVKIPSFFDPMLARPATRNI